MIARCYRLAGIFALLLTSTASAESIGFNFIGGGGSGSPGTIGPLEMAGAPGYAQSNWNNLNTDWSGNGGAVPATIYNSSGNVVSFPAITADPGAGAGIWFDSGTVWGNGAPNVTGNDHLMRGYLDDAGVNSTQPFVQLYNIPYPVYDLVMYFDGDQGSGGVDGPYWVETPTANPYAGGGVLLTPKIFGREAAYVTDAFSQVPLSSTTVGGAATGNYIVFSGLTASDINIRGSQVAGTRAPLNGFQIVASPEPSSIAIFGIAGLVCMLISVRWLRKRAAI